MKRLLVFLLAVGMAATPAIAAQSSDDAAAPSRALLAGVRVEMAASNHAMAAPDADDKGAWIVTVGGDGTLYFGIDPVTPEELTNEMRNYPRERPQNLYIKADARAMFAEVQTVFTAAARTGFERPILLTFQAGRETRGIVPPKGLEVRIDAGSDGEMSVVRLLAAQPLPGLEIDRQRVPWSGVRDALDRISQSGRG